MIKEVVGNVLLAKEDIICHQVNCKGVMGSGIAKQIRTKYPEVYEEYHKYCESANLVSNSASMLGNAQFIECADGKVVANLFGQNNFGKDGASYTDYKSLKSAFIKLYEYMVNNKKSLAIPSRIGCGLGGGDWDIVYYMINEIFKDVDVVIYNYL